MKNWLMLVGGGLIVAVAVWLIIFFAPQVLLFLEGIAGIIAVIIGGVILAIGVSGVKTNLEEKKQRKPEAAKANPENKQ